MPLAVAGVNPYGVADTGVNEIPEDGIQVVAVDDDVAGFAGESGRLHVVRSSLRNRPDAIHFPRFDDLQTYFVSNVYMDGITSVCLRA